MTTPLVDLFEVRDTCDATRQAHKAMAKRAPWIRLWANPPSGEESRGLILRGVVRDSIAGQFPFTIKEPAQGTLRLRLDHYLAKWLISIPDDPEAKKNVVISVDHMGRGKNCKLRWSGMLHHWQVTKDGQGVYYLEAVFVDDRQMISFLLGPPNPALPIPIFQFPRVLPLFGPARWIVSFLILINIMRVEASWWTLPDDPFTSNGWMSKIDSSRWQAHIKCGSLLGDDSLWALLATRMQPLDTVISEVLDDAKLVLTYRRYFTDDGETVEDAGLDLPSIRNGAVVFEVVDKSGYHNPDGTWFNGGIIGGLTRSAVQFLDGFIESILTPVTDDQTIWPDSYYEPGFFGQVPNRPWIVLRDSKWSQIETSNLAWNPAGPVSVVVGGANPYADQLAELTIQMVGNILGYFALAGFSSAGDIAASVIMPFLQGTILAWQRFTNHQRAHNLGWVHLWEIYQQGGDSNAWSLAALGALREGFEATKSQTTHEFTMGIGPIYPGIHFMPGDRLGSTAEKIIPNKVFVDAVQEITLTWDFSSGGSDGPMYQYTVQVGTNTAAMSIAERQARLISKALETLQEIGVRMIT
ncbi:minor tail protein [Gordonia phage Neville]|uniref:Minor tail protein n=1 Tax=Gordonia phage Neville TaxID=2301693 RepID=A0A385DXZ6_9CAUD|nr:minor tail protein [Gordonia phage Neville]AXQ64400.1 minor tail protein [Gordonia phage Neville]